MILTETIEIKIGSNNIKHYRELGYECNVKESIVVKVEHLKNQSTVKIHVKCDVCEKEKEVEYRKYNNNKNNKDLYTCSLSCSQIKIKLTKMENHGDPNFSGIEKRNKTCKERYNNETYKNVEKRKETNQERYGYEHVIMNTDIQEKRKNTWMEIYGEEHPMKCQNIIEKKKDTCKELYNNENYTNIEKTLETIKLININLLKTNFLIDVIDYKDKLFSIICEKGHTYNSYYDLIYKRNKYNNTQCTICNPIGVKYSDIEQNMFNFIKENYDGEIIINSRQIIKPYELDIYLPEINLAFEFNGLFWHSELYRDKKYHKMKYHRCLKKNIQLIQIFEDDWNYKQDIIKSMILYKLNKINHKIYARKCNVIELNDNDIKNFLVDNHIQGYTKSSIKIGLIYNEELVSVMTFMKKSDDYELNRFCNKLNTNIIGSANKLFSYFKTNFNYNKITTFSNNSYSNGNLYYILNFKKLKDLDEDYSYIVNGRRQHKFNFRKKGIKTERDMNLENGYLRIYDAGKVKFIYS